MFCQIFNGIYLLFFDNRIISISAKKLKPGKLFRQPGDFPPCFSEENPLSPRLALLLGEKPGPLTSGWLPTHFTWLRNNRKGNRNANLATLDYSGKSQRCYNDREWGLSWTLSGRPRSTHPPMGPFRCGRADSFTTPPILFGATGEGLI